MAEAWLGQFDPGQMILYGFLVAFFQRGSTKAASYAGISKTDFSSIVTGMFFLIVIATEFFVNYKIVIKKKEKKEDTSSGNIDSNITKVDFGEEGSK